MCRFYDENLSFLITYMSNSIIFIGGTVKNGFETGKGATKQVFHATKTFFFRRFVDVETVRSLLNISNRITHMQYFSYFIHVALSCTKKMQRNMQCRKRAPKN